MTAPNMPARDVLNHRRRAAVVEKDAGLFRDEGEINGFAGVDRPIIFQEIDLRRMEIHGVRIFILGGIRQREFDGIPFGHADDGAWHLAIKRPGCIGFAPTLDHDILLDRRHLDLVCLGVRRIRHPGDDESNGKRRCRQRPLGPEASTTIAFRSAFEPPLNECAHLSRRVCSWTRVADSCWQESWRIRQTAPKII